MKKGRFSFAVWALAGLLPVNASAGWACSIEEGYPGVSDLAVVGSGLVVTLGPYFNDGLNRKTPYVFLYTPFHGWEPTDIEVPPPLRYQDPCMEPLPFEKDQEWLENFFPGRASWHEPDQYIKKCATYKTDRWGGLAFYHGEGSYGVGGLVREDIKTGEKKTYRPSRLLEYSVNALEAFDGRLWIGTTQHHECGGPPPGFGLKRVDLRGSEDDDFWPTVEEVPEVCGFAVRDMVVFQDQLWVATELGLSRARYDDDFELVWENWVPDLTYRHLMRPVTCAQQYYEILRSPRSISVRDFEIGTVFEDFWSRLHALRPEFVKEHIKKLHGHGPENATLDREPGYQARCVDPMACDLEK